MTKLRLTRRADWQIFGRYLTISIFCMAMQGFFAMVVHADDLGGSTTNLSETQQRHPLLGRKFSPMQPTLVPAGLEYDDAVRRPLLYWHAWANQRLSFIKVAVGLLIALLPIRLLCPKIVASAKIQYEQHWAKSLGLGLLFLFIAGGCAGSLARTGLFAPLATVMVATIQLVSLFGLAVACDSVGNGTLQILRLDRRLGKNKLFSILPICLGILLCSLLVLVPGSRLLPGIGNRLFALIAAAGTGAVLVAIKITRRSETDS